jgi:hypothetical protein
VDGEGHIGIVRHNKGGGHTYHVLTVSTCNVHPDVLRIGKETWGGSLSLHSRSNPRHNPVWFWVLTSHGATLFLRAIQPYAIVKRAQIDLALEFIDRCSFEKRGRSKLIPVEALALREEYRQRLLATHSKQGH